VETASRTREEPADAGKGLVAPEGQAQSELNLKKIHELLNDPAALKDLQQREGITKSDIEQFVRKYEKVAAPPPGPGREINVKPGEEKPVLPAKDLPELGPHTFSSRAKTDRGSMPQDDVANNVEDLRFRPPAELREKLTDYNNSLAKKGPGGKGPAGTKAKAKAKNDK
jgi:hypothetical protein